MSATRMLARVAITALATASVVALPSTPAQAGSCIALTAYTDTMQDYSDAFTIPSNSNCADLNAAYAYMASDWIRGWYTTSYGQWNKASRGYVWVTTSDSGWLVLVTQLPNGRMGKGQGYYYNQNVRYVV